MPMLTMCNGLDPICVGSGSVAAAADDKIEAIVEWQAVGRRCK